MNTETGHTINLANFSELAKHIQSFGSSYNPALPRLQYANLMSVHKTAVTAFEILNTVNVPYLIAISKREVAFDILKKLLTRINKNAEILLENPTALKAVKELIRRLRGQRATPKKNQEELGEGETPVVYHSVSQLSFKQRIEHFDELIRLLQGQPEYTPNEPELTIAYFNNLLNEMRTTNEAVIDAEIPVTQARNARNSILYTPVTGLVGIANDTKKYVLVAFGMNSAEYKIVRKLKFRNFPL
jgi:hypothetical protein